MRVKVSSEYRITLPARVREKLGLSPGDQLLLDVRGNCLILMPEPRDYPERLRGLHRELWKGVEPQE